MLVFFSENIYEITIILLVENSEEGKQTFQTICVPPNGGLRAPSNNLNED